MCPVRHAIGDTAAASINSIRSMIFGRSTVGRPGRHGPWARAVEARRRRRKGAAVSYVDDAVGREAATRNTGLFRVGWGWWGMKLIVRTRLSLESLVEVPESAQTSFRKFSAPQEITFVRGPVLEEQQPTTPRFDWVRMHLSRAGLKI